MSEVGDFESFTGPAPSESTEKNDEKFREQIKKSQQAQQQLQKEEGKAKKNDGQLAKIIVKFLGQPENTDLFLLISRTVSKNMPSEFIIAILALINKEAHKEVKALLETSENEKSKALVLQQKADFETISPQLKHVIDKWINELYRVATNKPYRFLEAIIIPGETRRLIYEPIQLASFILRRYLLAHDSDIPFDNIRDFIQQVFVEIVVGVEKLTKEQKRLDS